MFNNAQQDSPESNAWQPEPQHVLSPKGSVRSGAPLRLDSLNESQLIVILDLDGERGARLVAEWAARGFSAILAPSALQAIHILERGLDGSSPPVGLVLFDPSSCERDGIDWLALLEGDERLCQVPTTEIPAEVGDYASVRDLVGSLCRLRKQANRAAS